MDAANRGNERAARRESGQKTEGLRLFVGECGCAAGGTDSERHVRTNYHAKSQQQRESEQCTHNPKHSRSTIRRSKHEQHRFWQFGWRWQCWRLRPDVPLINFGSSTKQKMITSPTTKLTEYLLIAACLCAAIH